MYFWAHLLCMTDAGSYISILAVFGKLIMLGVPVATDVGMVSSEV